MALNAMALLGRPRDAPGSMVHLMPRDGAKSDVCCVAVSPNLGGQGAGAVPQLGFLPSSPPWLNKIPHHSCDALMFFVQLSVYEVLKRQKHLSNLILANSCRPSVEQQQQQKNPCKNQGKCL